MRPRQWLRGLPVLACVGGWLAAGSGASEALAQAAKAPATVDAGEEGVKITQQGTVELHARGTDLRRVLQLLSTQSKINIVAGKDVTGVVTADLYGVTFNQALDAVLRLTGYTYVQRGNFIYVGTAEQLEAVAGPPRTKVAKVFKLNYITANDAKGLVLNVLSKDGTVTSTPPSAKGIASTADSAGGNDHANEDVIIVHDYPDTIEKVTAILKEVDVRPQQVLIEATLLRARLTEKNALGVDFNALGGVNFEAMGATSTAGGSLTPGSLSGQTMNHSNPVSNFRTDFNSGIDSGGLTIGVINKQIAFFIRALESVTDVSVLANPTLLVMNKQRGEVMVGNRDGYLTTTVTETTATQTVQFIETGTRLVVRPFIAADGFIRLELHPEDSTGGINTQSLPFEQTTEVTSNVLVKDGHTIVIGGLFRERTSNDRAQVPGLGNIPWAGALFRRRSEETNREEVIVLVTPHIIRHPVDAVASEQLRDDVQRFRLGMRQGLMWFGRERLAQSFMRSARQELDAGDPNKALWNVNLALSMQPRLEGALRLKERLTHQAIWAEETRHSSIHHVIQKMVMQELGRPVDEVILPLKPRDGATLSKDVREAMGIGPKLESPLPGEKGAGEGRKDQPATRPAPGGPASP